MHKKQGSFYFYNNFFPSGMAIAKRVVYSFLMRPFHIFVIFALMIFPALEAPLRSEVETQASQPRYGGTLRLASYGKPAPFDPFNVTDTISAPLMALLFNKLIRFNGEGAYEPDLAERWEISEDGLVYTFHLRRDVKFHDGTSCTSKDVMHSLQLFKNPKVSPVYHKYFDIVEKMEAPSDFIFRITLKEPYSSFLSSVWIVKIVPERKLDNEENRKNFIEHPIGTGPFKFGYRESSGDIFFLSHEDYHEGRPYLNSLMIRSLSKDQVWAAFLRGEIDIAFYLQPEHQREIKEDPSFQIFRAPSLSSYVLIFNLENKLFADKRVREAFAYAINRDELMRELEDGRGIPANGPFFPHSWAFNPAVKDSLYDSAKALELLKQAGFEQGEEGLSREGKKLTLEITLAGNNDHLLRMAKLIRQQLQEIGIQTKFSFYSNFDELAARVYQKGDFQIHLCTYHAPLEPYVAGEQWHSQQKRAHYAMRGYQNKEVDGLLDSIRRETSEEKRKESYYKIHSLIESDRPAVFLYFPYVFFAAAKNFHVPGTLFSPVIPYYHLKDVYVVESQPQAEGG